MDQSRPSISKVKSANVRLVTGLGTATSLASVMKSILKPGRILLLTLFNEMDETDPLMTGPLVKSKIKVTQHAAQWSYGSKYSKLKKSIEIQLVRLTEVLVIKCEKCLQVC